MARLGNPVILISRHAEPHPRMSRVLLVIVLAVVALMVVAWALGRIMFFLRATFPTQPKRRGPRRGA